MQEDQSRTRDRQEDLVGGVRRNQV